MNKLNYIDIGIFSGSLVALILSIGAIATPNWAYNEIDGIASYYGLWRFCQMFELTEVCYYYESVTTSMVILRTLELVGVLLLTASLFTRLLVYYRMRRRPIVFIWDGLLAFLSGSSIAVGTIIFGCETQYELSDDGDTYGLHISFACCVLAGIVAVAMGILRILTERKRWFNLQETRVMQNQQPLSQAYFRSSPTPAIVLTPSSHNAYNNQTYTGPPLNSESSTIISADSEHYSTLQSSIENEAPLTVRLPTLENNHGDSASTVREEPSGKPSLPLCNLRMVSE